VNSHTVAAEAHSSSAALAEHNTVSPAATTVAVASHNHTAVAASYTAVP